MKKLFSLSLMASAVLLRGTQEVYKFTTIFNENSQQLTIISPMLLNFNYIKIENPVWANSLMKLKHEKIEDFNNQIKSIIKTEIKNRRLETEIDDQEKKFLVKIDQFKKSVGEKCEDLKIVCASLAQSKDGRDILNHAKPVLDILEEFNLLEKIDKMCEKNKEQDK